MGTKDKIIDLISQITKLEKDILEESSLNEKPWDSFQNVEIIFAIEEEFGIMLSQEEIAELKTLNCIINVVEGHIK